MRYIGLGWLLSMLLTAPGLAGEACILETIPAPPGAENSGFGWDAKTIGDIDADGTMDFIVSGDPGLTGEGSVWVYSGATLSVTNVLSGEQFWDAFGESLGSAEDLNADGFLDIIVGAPKVLSVVPGYVCCYSGYDQVLLHRWEGVKRYEDFGAAVDGAGDTNADGYGDVVVGSWDGGFTGYAVGQVTVFSGKDGGLIRQWTGTDEFVHLGYCVAGVGDVDRDGHSDIAASGTHPLTATTYETRVRVYSLRRSELLFEVKSSEVNTQFGDRLLGTGDMNGDDVPDLAIGSPNSNLFAQDAGFVLLVSGRDGAPLQTFGGPYSEESLGATMALHPDVDRDGVPELMTGSSSALLKGRIRLVSGAKGAELGMTTGLASNEHYGRSCLSIGDVNGDDLADALIFSSGGVAGPPFARMVSWVCGKAEPYGSGCGVGAAAPLKLSTSGLISLIPGGLGVTFCLTGAFGANMAVLLASGAPADLDLGAGCSLLVGLPALPIALPVNWIAGGGCLTTGAIPATASVGSVYVQGFAAVPGAPLGLAATNGIEFRIE